jgi:hypothetical protein
MLILVIEGFLRACPELRENFTRAYPSFRVIRRFTSSCILSFFLYVSILDKPEGGSRGLAIGPLSRNF